MKKSTKNFAIRQLEILFLLLFLPGVVFARDPYKHIPGLIHMDSEISSGELTLEKLAELARSSGAKVGFVTDHDTHSAEYGIPPLRNFVKIPYNRPSVLKYGYENYFRDIREIDKKMDDFLFLPGIEAVPYYQWIGKPFTTHFGIEYMHRHFLVFGLDTVEEWENIPSIEAGYPDVWSYGSLLKIISPFFFLAIALILYDIKRSKRVVRGGRTQRKRYKPYKWIAIPLFIFSILLFINNFPFKKQLVTQYDQGLDWEPYQYFFDYVASHGGVVYIAHPEASYSETFGEGEAKAEGIIGFLKNAVFPGGLQIQTLPYTKLLEETENYTGFSIFHEGFEIVGKPGGIWDKLLVEYAQGKRSKPVWTIGEMDIEEVTDSRSALESVTVFLVDSLSEKSLINALKTGKMYAARNFFSEKVELLEWSISGKELTAYSGQILDTKGPVSLFVDMKWSDDVGRMNLVVIKNGEMIINQPLNMDPEFRWNGPPLQKGSMDVYRIVLMRKKWMTVATNPIFVRNM